MRDLIDAHNVNLTVLRHSFVGKFLGEIHRYFFSSFLSSRPQKAFYKFQRRYTNFNTATEKNSYFVNIRQKTYIH